MKFRVKLLSLCKKASKFLHKILIQGKLKSNIFRAEFSRPPHRFYHPAKGFSYSLRPLLKRGHHFCIIDKSLLAEVRWKFVQNESLSELPCVKQRFCTFLASSERSCFLILHLFQMDLFDFRCSLQGSSRLVQESIF